jgi:DNA methyltransferase 1-associated protein 1
MADVKDILGVPRGGAAADKQEKPKEQKLVKPKGMSRCAAPSKLEAVVPQHSAPRAAPRAGPARPRRPSRRAPASLAAAARPRARRREAFALLSSTHPLVPSQLLGELKKQPADGKEKPRRRGQVTFRWQPFANPARADGLALEHWVKCYKDAATGAVAPAEKDYAFAKYDRHAPAVRYSDEEWAALIAPDAAWTRAETDYLLDLAARLDLRWLVVADRWDPPAAAEAEAEAEGAAGAGTSGGAVAAAARPRSVEDLKARYYSVARQLLVGRAGGPDSVSNHSLVRQPFSAAHERERKRGLELLMARSPAQDAQEEVVLGEASKIEARRRAAAAAAAKKAPAAAAAAGPSAGAAAAPRVEVSAFEDEPPVGTLPLFDAKGLPAAIPPADDAEPGAPPPRVIARVAHTKALLLAMVAGVEPEAARLAVQGSMVELKMADLPRAASRAVCGAYVSLVAEVIEHLDLKRALVQRAALVAVGGKRAKPEDGGAGDADGEPRSEKRQRVAKRAYE